MGLFDQLFGKHGHHHGRHHERDGHRVDVRHEGISSGNICPGCRTSTAAADRFCRQCGQSLLPAPCKQCGIALAPGARFCVSCGSPST
ncbi:MAG: zinc ribbon domain-containing protein [Hydrogenophaga sp.]|uniref:double zinc ribbon domain-containing protein n=1 Tax=Hydrogenophaga sp. TaxID=1904254 RepID=UPI001DB549AF|nr:zinc ribbon domain-containing protein [Hydrogenophaga sp.]MBX3611290.1 zinc ribbon domain-containing protein [Hydrogenophaga sp.]